MQSLLDEFHEHYNAIAEEVKGGAPSNQVMWVAALLTLFKRFEGWVKGQENKGG